MYLVASDRPSVCPSVCQCALSRLNCLGARLCQVQQRAKKGHYQSKEFVCVDLYIVYTLKKSGAKMAPLWNVLDRGQVQAALTNRGAGAALTLFFLGMDKVSFYAQLITVHNDVCIIN